MHSDGTSRTLELARQTIDEELQHANGVEAHKLKTRRNTLAYISLLPTEIISKIFCILAFSCLGRSDSDLSWIPSVTAICSHWRTIALECPNLWSFIDFSRPNWVEEMLKRSKMVPLIIKADYLFYPIRPDVVDAIRLSLQHISRIKELRLSAPIITIANLIDSFDVPAPLLQSLHLCGELGMFSLSETHFVCGGRLLHRLELINCIIPWQSPLLCGLRHFKFAKPFDMAHFPATQLCDALEKMPLLESLDLEGLSPVPSGDTKRVVHLPHLTSLRLSYAVPDGAHLLKLISFPASTSLVLHCRFTSRIDYSSVCDAISSVWNGKDGSQLLQCLVLNLTYSELKGWTTSERTDEPPSSPTQLEVLLSWEYQDDTDDNMITNLCNALTLTNLHTLFVHDPAILTATWLSAFGHLTSLRTLHLNGTDTVVELISALSKKLKNTEEVFLSGLYDLWLEKTGFGDNRHIFEDLRDCLMTRCHWNAELQGLHVRDYFDLSPEDVDLLREIVVDVDWVQVKKVNQLWGSDRLDGVNP